MRFFANIVRRDQASLPARWDFDDFFPEAGEEVADADEGGDKWVQEAAELRVGEQEEGEGVEGEEGAEVADEVEGELGVGELGGMGDGEAEADHGDDPRRRGNEIGVEVTLMGDEEGAPEAADDEGNDANR